MSRASLRNDTHVCGYSRRLRVPCQRTSRPRHRFPFSRLGLRHSRSRPSSRASEPLGSFARPCAMPSLMAPLAVLECVTSKCIAPLRHRGSRVSVRTTAQTVRRTHGACLRSFRAVDGPSMGLASPLRACSAMSVRFTGLAPPPHRRTTCPRRGRATAQTPRTPSRLKGSPGERLAGREM